MGYNLLINGVYIGVITRLLLTFDPNFQRDIQVGQQQTGQEQEQKINDSPVSGYVRHLFKVGPFKRSSCKWGDF